MGKSCLRFYATSFAESAKKCARHLLSGTLIFRLYGVHEPIKPVHGKRAARAQPPAFQAGCQGTTSSTPALSWQSSSVIVLILSETAMYDESYGKIESAAIFVGCGSFFFVCRFTETRSHTAFFSVTFDSKTDSKTGGQQWIFVDGSRNSIGFWSGWKTSVDGGRRGMPKGGLEPPCPYGHNALNVACLPISPLRLVHLSGQAYITVSFATCQ